MILVDTSILIDYFKGTDNDSIKKFEYINEMNIPFGINSLIYHELLQGAYSTNDFNKLKKYLDSQMFYNLKNQKKSYVDSALIYFKCRKKGVTIRSSIDCIIAQTAIENDLHLLHNDDDFKNMSKIIKNLKIY